MLKPRQHQIDAYNAIHSELLHSDRALVTMACGTGKTKLQTMLVDLVDEKTGRIVIFAPTLLLINQLLNTWVSETGIPFENFAVLCSDEKTGALDDVDISEIKSTKVYVAKDTADISSFLDIGLGLKVVISTYSSAKFLNGFSFNLGIFDESHKTVGLSDRPYSYALFNKNIEISKKVFMTATPKLAKHKTADVASMDNAKIFGNTVYDLSFRKAIDAELILDYLVLVTVITKNDLSSEMLKKINEEGVSLLHYANAIALRKAMDKYDIKKAISFHETINKAETFKVVAQSTNKMTSVHISSRQHKNERSENMQIFKASESAIATNARCLSEGIDVPNVDAVLFADPKDSTIDIVQAAGRTMRLHDGKEKGYIILPIYLETFAKDDFKETVQKNDFELVWSVLSSLQESDETLAFRLRQIYQSLGKKRKGHNLSGFVDVISDDSINANKLLDAISIESAAFLIESFEYRLGQFESFVEQHENGFVPTNYEDKNFAYWANWMRTAYRYNQLPLYKINALLERGFIFNLDEWRWEKRFLEYKLFSETQGVVDHKDYPKNIKKWLSVQTELKTNGKLSDDRFNKLLSVGFIYNNKSNIWMAGYNNLVQELQHKTSLSDFVKSEKSYDWLRVQRRRWDKLSNDKKNLLLKIGWEDYVSNIGRWKNK